METKMDGQSNAEHRDVAGEALGRLVRRWRESRRPDDAPLEGMTSQAFRQIVAERLRALERDTSEVRTRVNGLLFVVAGAVVTQVVLRLLG